MWILQEANPGVPVKQGGVKVAGFSYEGYASPLHHCMLKDEHGNIVFETYGSPELTPVDKHFEPIWLYGLTLEDLESGRVVVTTL